MPGVQLTYDRKRRESVTIPLPLSKSMAARALVISAWVGRKFEVEPFCTDTEELSRAVDRLLGVTPHPSRRLKEENADPVTADFDLGLGGTSLRFFVSLVASIPGLKSTVTCADALRQRPLNPLLEALNAVGSEIRFLAKSGYPPLSISGRRLEGRELEVLGNISSQFASSLMMSAPYWKEGVRLRWEGEVAVSKPYIEMTAEMMRRAGADVEMDAQGVRINGSGYSPKGYTGAIEGDWSSASYFYELALLCSGREIRLRNLVRPEESVQGDSRCAEIFRLIGVETRWTETGEALLLCDAARRDVLARMGVAVELDMASTPDLVPALAVGLCLSGIMFRFRGVSHLRHKESDRLSVLKLELEKVGYSLLITNDTLSWTGGRTPVGENETIDPCSDHRIAMAFAVGAAVLPYLSISDPGVVSKSYPDFFEDLERAGFSLRYFGR